jgi:ATP-dependent Zn protease
VKTLVMDAYHRAFDFLKNHRDLLEKAALKLIQKETLNEEELKQFFQNLDSEKNLTVSMQ